MVKEPVGEVYLSAEVIQTRVKELGQNIAADYRGQELMLVGILRASFVFMADLVRHIDIPLSVGFMAVSSYEGEGGASGAV
ncbi:MAG TPA: phosphoribosyltransferase family protein, partial [Syntrophobacteria bacterium]|nr:phosphoribosyltransferase family protein [Syntrophobacteria bacterium]